MNTVSDTHPSPDSPSGDLEHQAETGLMVMHLFCHSQLHTKKAIIDPGWKPPNTKIIRMAIKEFEKKDKKLNQIVSVEILGHKADIAFMLLSPSLENLIDFQRELQSSGLKISYSYLSMTELSEYAKELPEPMKKERLYPTVPPKEKNIWCFYPMSKSRGEKNNWFILPYEERKALMYEHGTSGRKFSGRVVQVVTGSTGIDDYEWGVTLFCESLQALKDVVYTLRFDEASAKYAEFGPFYTGIVRSNKEIIDALPEL